MKAIGTTAMAALLLTTAGQSDLTAAEASPAASPTIQQQVAAYAAAWSSRDADRIAALHTPDTIFDLRVDGETPAVGRQATRDQFARILRDNPNYASTVRKVGFGADFVVIEYEIAMSPSAPFVLGHFRYMMAGAPYAVPAIDVIHFCDGLVAEKVTFLDTDTIRAKSSAVAAVEPRQ